MTKSDLTGIDRRSFLRTTAAAGAATVLTGSMLSRVALGQQRGGTLRAALLGFNVVNTLDPQKAILNSDFWALSTMFNALVKFDGQMKIVPDLAENWSISPDLTTYTFNLRKGVKFHDGGEMTAEDVKFSLDRIRNPDIKVPNQKKFEKITAIDIVNKYTVRIKTSEPFAPLLTFLSSMPTGAQIISKTAFGKIGEEGFAKNPVGTGAFKIKEWRANEKLVFVAHKDYFEKGMPYLDGVDLLLIAEETSGITAILGGQIDLASTAPFADVPKLEKDPNITVTKVPGFNNRFMAMNLTKPPFNDVNFRRALSMSIERPAIVEAVLFGEGRPLAGAIPAALPWAYTKSRDICTFNPERAKAELAKSSVKPGTEVKVITWGSGWWKRWTEIVCAQVNQVLGMKFSPEVLEANVAFQKFRANDMEAQNTGWIGRVELDEYLGELFHSKGARNFNGYSNPKVDTIIEASRREFDQAKRGDLARQAEDIIAEEVALLFCFNANAHSMMSKKVKGFVALPSQSLGSQFPPVSLG